MPSTHLRSWRSGYVWLVHYGEIVRPFYGVVTRHGHARNFHRVLVLLIVLIGLFIRTQLLFFFSCLNHFRLFLFFLLLLFGFQTEKVAQARLNKSGMRPLGRTQSAPLPLGHPLLQGAPHGVVPTVPLTQQQFDQYVRERQIYEQQHQHNLLKQVLQFRLNSLPVDHKKMICFVLFCLFANCLLICLWEMSAYPPDGANSGG